MWTRSDHSSLGNSTVLKYRICFYPQIKSPYDEISIELNNSYKTSIYLSIKLNNHIAYDRLVSFLKDKYLFSICKKERFFWINFENVRKSDAKELFPILNDIVPSYLSTHSFITAFSDIIAKVMPVEKKMQREQSYSMFDASMLRLKTTMNVVSQNRVDATNKIQEDHFKDLTLEKQQSIIDTCQNFSNLLQHEQLKFINALSKLKGLPSLIEDILENFNYLDVLPDEVLKDSIGPRIKNKSSLVCTYSRAYQLFQPELLASKLLKYIVTGSQDRAEQFLMATQKRHPQLLNQNATVTDYSGRTFHCSAYEYAYWAKDTHMCRMLERYMDESTKAELLKRIYTIEKRGLKYKQRGEDKCSSHFDFTPLKNALRAFVHGYDKFGSANGTIDVCAAWHNVGLAQRDLPIHVINEYCRPDRTFEPTPLFNDDELPRSIIFHNWDTDEDEELFSFIDSECRTKLGESYSLYRGGYELKSFGGMPRYARSVAGKDLAAMKKLDKVRTKELRQSRKNLELALSHDNNIGKPIS